MDTKILQMTENRNKNLLIVDDEIEITKSLQRQFRKQYNVFLTNSPLEAIDIMTQHEIHVVISDQRMPQMTGVEFFSKIKNDHPDAIRLILTGYTDIEAIVDAINDGNVYRYVAKPWNPTELENIISDAFEKYNLVIENKLLLDAFTKANELLEDKVKERTAELVDANRQLTELNATKDKFFSLIAHDLKGPFNNIVGLSNLLLESIETGDTKEIDIYAKLMQNASGQTMELLVNLLEWSRSQTGAIKYQPSLVNLSLLVDEVIALSKSQADVKHISLFRKSSDPIFISLDKTMISTVLRNLIANAIKFSYENSSIEVEIQSDNGQIRVQVSDHGVGITESSLNKLFRIDQSFSTKGTKDEKGTGLGLILCKEFIDNHKGKIWAESISGEGSRFIFTIGSEYFQITESTFE